MILFSSSYAPLLSLLLQLWLVCVPVLGFLIFSISNPIWAVLLLVLMFIGNSLVFLCFDAVYLGLLFIIVYVGAIAILFLFVIMLVNLRVVYTFSPKRAVFLFSIYVMVFFFCDVVLAHHYFLPVDYFRITDQLQIITATDLPYRTLYLTDSLSLLGYVFYNQAAVYLVTLGFLLLIILVGVVVLLRPALAGHLGVSRDISRRQIKNKILAPLRSTTLG
jgi:NADH:ubiquinone oxidoreductase subunit 6 (subunit J)